MDKGSAVPSIAPVESGFDPIEQQGKVEDAAPPALPSGTVEDALNKMFKLKGKLSTLQSERDQLFKVDPGEGRENYIFRIGSAVSYAERFNLQNVALEVVNRVDPALPVPRPIVGANGSHVQYENWEGKEYCFSLYTFLDGILLEHTTRSEKQRHEVGTTVARLGKALRQCDHPFDGEVQLWDITRAMQFRPLVDCIQDTDTRWRVDAVFHDFENETLPILTALPSQFIHSDCHPKNILVDRSDPTKITGIIDFGDMIRAPRSLDLGVVFARHTSVESPIEDACQILSAYQSEYPLSQEEIDILFDLACVRMAMRLVIWSWRQQRGESRTMSPTVISDVTLLLRAFQNLGRTTAIRAFRKAAGLSADL